MIYFSDAPQQANQAANQRRPQNAAPNQRRAPNQQPANQRQGNQQNNRNNNRTGGAQTNVRNNPPPHGANHQPFFGGDGFRGNQTTTQNGREEPGNEIVCNCNTPALKLTVRKEGANQGQQNFFSYFRDFLLSRE